MEAYRSVRPIAVSILAIALAALAMVFNQWPGMSLLMAAVVLLLSAVVIYQMHCAVTNLRRESKAIRESAAQAERHYIDVLCRLIRFSEARESYTRGRSERIGLLARDIALELNLGEEKAELMRLAGQLHDVGMLAVSETILNKRSALGSKEFRTVQKHSEISHELLEPLESLAPILPAIRYHHERMNGTGYPNGLNASQLPLEACILAVADSFDAMTHDRPHRSAITPLEALMELRRCSPAGYDPQCVEALAAVIHLPQAAREKFEMTSSLAASA